MKNFEVEILKPKAANILYDMEDMKLIRLKKNGALKKKNKKKPAKNLMAQIETGLKDVSLIQAGKIKPKTLHSILHGK
ncbi:MAG: hypothetical protein ACHQVK_01590 [Candidatus Paceibacterales bacterium]